MICVRSLPSMQPSSVTSTAAAAGSSAARVQSPSFSSALLPVRQANAPLQASQPHFGAPPKFSETLLNPTVGVISEFSKGIGSATAGLLLHPASWVIGAIGVIGKSMTAVDSTASATMAAASALSATPMATAAAVPVVAASVVAPALSVVG